MRQLTNDEIYLILRARNRQKEMKNTPVDTDMRNIHIIMS